MKKGDTAARNTELPVGYRLLRGATSRDKADQWMKQTCEKTYGQMADYEVVEDPDNLGCYCVQLISPLTRVLEARVNWVFEHEMAITYTDGLSAIIDLTEQTDWYVLVESDPEFQSSVEHMSEDALRASISALRNSRSSIKPTRSKKVSTPKVKVDNSPLAKALRGLSEDAKQELQRKLGLID